MSNPTGPRTTAPRIEIHPARALVDQPVTVCLSGFEARHRVTLRARMADYLGYTWESHATFTPIILYDEWMSASAALLLRMPSRVQILGLRC